MNKKIRNSPYYILVTDEDGRPKVVEATPWEYLEWIAGEAAGRHSGRIGLSFVDDFAVSTVFTGVDTGLGDEPEIFDTAVFDRNFDEVWAARSSTLAYAKAAHVIATWIAGRRASLARGDTSGWTFALSVMFVFFGQANDAFYFLAAMLLILTFFFATSEPIVEKSGQWAEWKGRLPNVD